MLFMFLSLKNNVRLFFNIILKGFLISFSNKLCKISDNETFKNIIH